MTTTGKAYNPPRKNNIEFNSLDFADENNNIITTKDALERYKFISTGAGQTSVSLLNELEENTGLAFGKTATETSISSMGAGRTRFNIDSANGCVYVGGDGTADSGVCFDNMGSAYTISNLNTLTCANGFLGDLNGNATSAGSSTNALDCDAIQPNINNLQNITNFNCLDFTVGNNATLPNLIADDIAEAGGATNPFTNTSKLNTTKISNISQGETSTPSGNYINIQGNGNASGIGVKSSTDELKQITFENLGSTRPAFLINKGDNSTDNDLVPTALRHRTIDSTEFGVFPSGGALQLEFQMISDFVTSAGARVVAADKSRFRWNAKGKWFLDPVDFNYLIIEPHHDNGGGSSGLITFPENTVVRGSLTGGTKSFKIQHPLDENKTLSHIAIEAPRVENMYQGLVKLINGYAEIDMDIFSKLSSGSWKIINHNACGFVSNTTSFKSVRSNIKDGLLKIYCEDETSDDIISWLVIAERNDKELITSDMTDDNGRLITEYVPEPLLEEEEIEE